MRVYLGTTAVKLSRLITTLATSGQCDLEDSDVGQAHSLTPALREWYTGDDVEELEYAAFLNAAYASLRQLVDQISDEHRRVVLSIDVDPSSVQIEQSASSSALTKSAVRLNGVLTREGVASVHIDEAASRSTITAAVSALSAADAGDDDALFLVDEASACDLLWFDSSELELALLDLGVD